MKLVSKQMEHGEEGERRLVKEEVHEDSGRDMERQVKFFPRYLILKLAITALM